MGHPCDLLGHNAHDPALDAPELIGRAGSVYRNEPATPTRAASSFSCPRGGSGSSGLLGSYISPDGVGYPQKLVQVGHLGDLAPRVLHNEVGLEDDRGPLVEIVSGGHDVLK